MFLDVSKQEIVEVIEEKPGKFICSKMNRCVHDILTKSKLCQGG
jgi:hypothetical protein